MGNDSDQPSMDAGTDAYDWPEESAPESPQPGAVLLIVLYLSPVILLLLFPAIAWIALLPLTFLVNRTTHPAHRRRAVLVYLITGLISLAPWIAMLFG